VIHFVITGLDPVIQSFVIPALSREPAERPDFFVIDVLRNDDRIDRKFRRL
jgi:hypothetical protein